MSCFIPTVKMRCLIKPKKIIFHKNFSFLAQSEPYTGNINSSNQYEMLNKVVTPLAHLPYEEQLKEKEKWCKQVVNKLRASNNSSQNKNMYLNKIIPSPVLNNYRNKDEFNIRSGIDGNPKTVGFIYGTPANNDAICIRPTYIINMKEKHKQIARGFEKYINSSPFEACHDFKECHWRSLLVRSNEKGQTLAMIQFHPQQLEEAIIDSEIQNIKDYYLFGEGKPFAPDTLYFQLSRQTRSTYREARQHLIFGNKPFIEEQMLHINFRISPDSFFQINTPAAKVLYKKCMDFASGKSYSTILDLCCGSGAFSLLCSGRVRGCVGIDLNSSSIIDARINARYNNIHNVEFLSGRIEKRLKQVLTDLDMASDIIAFLNPGTSGVGLEVIEEINRNRQISRIIYVSCLADHPNVIKNLSRLIHGQFHLNSILPIDMFPHTYQTEMIFDFSRNN